MHYSQEALLKIFGKWKSELSGWLARYNMPRTFLSRQPQKAKTTSGDV